MCWTHAQCAGLTYGTSRHRARGVGLGLDVSESVGHVHSVLYAGLTQG